jgi:hypothetical protein
MAISKRLALGSLLTCVLANQACMGGFKVSDQFAVISTSLSSQGDPPSKQPTPDLVLIPPANLNLPVDPVPPIAKPAPEQTPGDATSTFLLSPNWPLKKALPVRANAAIGDGLTLEGGATNAFSLVMGAGQPGANMTTSQSIRDVFFMNYISGDQTKVIGSPVDNGQGDNNTFAAVARHYVVGDPNDVHVMKSDGMHLRAMCSNNHTDCRPGKVYGAMVRLPFEWRPGSTLKVRYKSAAGDHSWNPIWTATGSQISPGPGGDPYAGFGTSAALARSSSRFFEIDWNDNYSRFSQNVKTGYQIDFGTPDIYGIKWNTPPHGVYWAQGSGYVFHANAGPEFEQLPVNMASGFHDLVGNWRGDGSNLLDLFIDGKLISTVYMEFNPETYVDPADGKTKTVAMNLMIGNQAIPGFSPGAAQAVDNDGMPDGWTMVVQEVSGWYGNIQSPDSYRAAPNALP